MNRGAEILALGLLLACAVAQAGEPQAQTDSGAQPQPSNARFSPAILCVAVLESEVKSDLQPDPTPQQRQQWQHRLESALSQMGNAYLDGLSIAAGKPMLQAAESEVASWPASRLEPQARACERKGQALFQQASGLEQLLIRRSAQRLLQRELAKLALPPAR